MYLSGLGHYFILLEFRLDISFLTFAQSSKVYKDLLYNISDALHLKINFNLPSIDLPLVISGTLHLNFQKTLQYLLSKVH
jgi:hypothetical protein